MSRSLSRNGGHTPTCAVIEHTRRHGETLPTLIWCLNDLGIGVHLFASRRVRLDDPFAYTTGLQFDRPSLGTYWRSRFGGFHGYDFVLFNTLERRQLIKLACASKVPVVAVMHHGANLAKPEYSSFFSAGNRRPLVLAKHVAELAFSRCEVSWIAPVLIGDADRVTRRRDPSAVLRRFCVQGYLSFAKRNYPSLLDAAEELASEGGTPFKIVVVGRDHPDGPEFKAQVAARGLSSFFEFSDFPLSYEKYYALVGSTGFILPLVDSSSQRFERYYYDKITSSLSLSLATAIVPIVERRLAELYGISDQAILYDAGHLADGIRTALTIDQSRYDRLRVGLGQKREMLLRESTANLRQLLIDLSVRLDA